MPVVADTNTAESPPATSNGNAKSLSTLENHTIPPFYACYLLRSKKNGTFTKMTYVGSTPDPPRRIRQHNGIITMGARKTRFFRPWEMEAIVYGFPSKLAALQFEWAWQNAETSRYLRRPAPPELIKEKPVSYFPIRANNRSPLSKITILQRLLVSMPWSRMTLSVQLFSLDAQEWWDTCPPTTLRPGSTINNPAPSSSSRVSKASLKAIAASIKEKQLLEAGYGEIEKPNLVDVKNFLRIEGVDGEREYRNQNLEAPKKGTCLPIPVEDEAWTEEHLAKWDRALPSGPSLNCTICHEAVDTSDHTSFALCQGQDDCYALTHLSCLSKRFLSQEASTSTSPPPLLPDKGTCPSCESPLRWGDLIRGSYRRKEHAEDGGVTRKRNLARMARMAKLLANRDAFAGGDDEARSEEEIHVNEEGDAPVKKITRKGRPPKAVKSKEDLVEEKKTKTTRKAKSATDTAKKNAKTTKVKTKGKAAFSTSSKKPAMAYEDISDSGSDLSEVSERFDFDSEDDGLDLVSGNNNKEDEDDSRSSDFERQAAFHAAAEVSLEIQTNDLDVLDSVTSSPVSISPHAARTLESPTKRRRKMSDLSDDLADFLYQLRTTSTARVGTERTLATLTGTAGKETSKILAISDSD